MQADCVWPSDDGRRRGADAPVSLQLAGGGLKFRVQGASLERGV